MDWQAMELPTEKDYDDLLAKLKDLYAGCSITKPMIVKKCAELRIKRGDVDTLYQIASDLWLNSPHTLKWVELGNKFREQRRNSISFDVQNPLTQHLNMLRRVWTDDRNLRQSPEHRDFWLRFKDCSDQDVWHHWLATCTAGMEADAYGRPTKSTTFACVACQPSCGKSHGACRAERTRHGEAARWESELKKSNLPVPTWLWGGACHRVDRPLSVQAAEVF